MKSGLGGVEHADQPCPFWQLLTQNRFTADTSTAEALIAHGRSSKYVDLKDLVNRKRVKLAVVDKRELVVGPIFEQRLATWRTCTAGVTRQRLIRWEIMKAQMAYDVVSHAGVVRDEGVGRVLVIPLCMSAIPTTELSIEVRTSTLNNPVVTGVLEALWTDIVCATNGAGLTAALYFDAWRLVVSALLVHLSDREVHQLVTLEAEADYSRTPQQLQPLYIADGGDAVLDGNARLSKLTFMKSITIIALAWMETHSVTEAVNFCTTIAGIWRVAIRDFRLQSHNKDAEPFYDAFGRKDASLLVPNIPAKCLSGNQTLIEFANAQLALSVKLRFGMLLSDPPITEKARLRKRGAKGQGREKVAAGLRGFLTPMVEADRRTAYDSEADDGDASQGRDDVPGGAPSFEDEFANSAGVAEDSGLNAAQSLRFDSRGLASHVFRAPPVHDPPRSGSALDPHHVHVLVSHPLEPLQLRRPDVRWRDWNEWRRQHVIATDVQGMRPTLLALPATTSSTSQKGSSFGRLPTRKVFSCHRTP